MVESELKQDDIVEVLSHPSYNTFAGIQYKISELRSGGLVVGQVTKPIETKPYYPVGKNIQFFPESLVLVERGGKKIEIKKIKIFAKEGWGPHES